MRREPSDFELGRLSALLSEMRALEVRVDVWDRVMTSIAALRREADLLPTPLQIAWALAAFLAACLGGSAGLASTMAREGADRIPALVVASTAVGGALLVMARQVFELLAPLGRALLSLLEILALPAGHGRLTLAASTDLAVTCLLTLVLTTAILLWRDLSRSGARLDRRTT